MAKYESPFSVGRRQTVFVSSNDPRNKNARNLENYRSKLGADVIVKDMKQPLTLEEYVAPPVIIDWMNLYANYATEASTFAYDNQNNLYLLVRDESYPDYNFMYFLQKIDSDGNFIWEIKIDYTDEDWGGHFSNPNLSTDSVGNLYISAGLSTDISSKTDIIINIKIDTNGNIIWNKPISNSNYYLVENFGGLYRETFCKVDSEFNVYIVANIDKRTAWYSNPFTSHQLITKLDPSGNIIWQNIYQDTYYGSNNGFYQCYGIDIDSSNNLYTISNGSKGVLTKYDTSGNIVFIKQLNHSSLAITSVADIKIYQNNIYVSSISKASNTYFITGHVSLLKLDTSGNIVWETNIGTIPFFNSYYSPLISLPDSGGIFINMPKYGGGSDTFFYIVKVNTDGTFIEQKKVTRPLNITPPYQYSPTHQTILLDINQKNNYLYCSGTIVINYTKTAFIFKIPSSLSDEYSISFQNATIRDEKNPEEPPYSVLASFNINIENASVYSPLSSSYITLSNYTNYASVSSLFISDIWPIIINKTTSPEPITSSGVFA